MSKIIAFSVARLSNKGGTERMSISLANALVDIGYTVVLISVQPCEVIFFEIDERIKVFNLFRKDTDQVKGVIAKALVYPKLIKKLSKVITSNNIDILIDVDIDLSFFSLPLKLWNKHLKIISWEHFHYKENLGLRRRSWARELSKKYADAIVVLTEQDKKAFSETNKSKAPITVIHNFLLSMPQEQASLKEKAVLAVGNYVYNKGFDILLDVWRCVKKTEVASDWVLNIVGDGEDKDKLEKKANQLTIQNSIKFIPPTRHIEEYYKTSSIFVLSSRYEGFGLVLLEARSYGLPSVAFDCPLGPREIINNEIDGYLINVNDITSMSEKIISLMQDIELRKKLGLKAKEDTNRFEKQNIVKRWVDLIENL